MDQRSQMRHRKGSGPSEKHPLLSSPKSHAAPSRVPWRAAIAVALFLLGYVWLKSGHKHQATNVEFPFHAGPAVGQVEGHADFDDGRKTTVHSEFLEPPSEGLHWVNTNLGNGGPDPNLSGGMIPAVAPPFGMTRWTPQSRLNYVSMTPYNQTDQKLHGFLGTHQPAIWMGEYGPSQISAGMGQVVTDFDARALRFERENEYASANYYSNILHAQDGDIFAELSATSRVGHLRFSFRPRNAVKPHMVVQASRKSALLHWDQTVNPGPQNVFHPLGEVSIDKERREISGWNDERQDRVLLSEEIPAPSFKGYFVARFSEPFEDVGTSSHGKLSPAKTRGSGEDLAGYVTFSRDTRVVDVRVGTSFISIEQARRNIDLEIPDGQSLEATSRSTRKAWADKVDLMTVSGATPQNRTVLYTAFAHSLVYPHEFWEESPSGPVYYSGYLDKILSGHSYTGYSIWDTFRAVYAWQLLVVPERVAGMITSMLQDYDEGGWLPMWKNGVQETNIMIGTHADSIIAQAMVAGVKDFDWQKAWAAVKKNAYTPPDRDTELRFEDREENTPQEVRAGLTEYMRLGYVAADLHSESASRTLDYAYDDYAASIVAEHAGDHDTAKALRARSGSWRNLFNGDTGFMEARNSDGSWAGEDTGWTEGDHWCYTLEVLHDTPGLIEVLGGNKSFIDFVDRHFDGGHNLHSNEPSHHIPYVYMYAGAAHKTQERVREIAETEYNHTAHGLSGNDDLGQMSCFYLFSAMGFYPMDPAGGVYVIGVPLFDKLSLELPGASAPLTISAVGASEGRRYVQSMTVNGKRHEGISLQHSQIKDGADIVFTMTGEPRYKDIYE